MKPSFQKCLLIFEFQQRSWRESSRRRIYHPSCLLRSRNDEACDCRTKAFR